MVDLKTLLILLNHYTYMCKAGKRRHMEDNWPALVINSKSTSRWSRVYIYPDTNTLMMIDICWLLQYLGRQVVHSKNYGQQWVPSDPWIERMKQGWHIPVKDD